MHVTNIVNLDTQSVVNRYTQSPCLSGITSTVLAAIAVIIAYIALVTSK
jgi:hypothetical protein